MIIVERSKKKNHVGENVYMLKQDDTIVKFYRSGNLDLSFTCYNLKKRCEYEFIINEDENYLFYKAIDKLYKTLLNDYKEKYGYEELFSNGYISWQSDAPANELTISDDFIYNYFEIHYDGFNYILKFINNCEIDIPFFTVELNTDRSRYGPLVFPFIDFLNDIKSITEPYRQITIDEYIHQKKLAK